MFYENITMDEVLVVTSVFLMKKKQIKVVDLAADGDFRRSAQNTVCVLES